MPVLSEVECRLFPVAKRLRPRKALSQDLSMRRSCGMAGTVLCGVNGSTGARTAARVAGAISKQLELRLVLVHVADAFTLADGSAGYDESVTTIQARSEASGCSTSSAPNGASEERSSESRSATLPSGSPRSPRRNEQR
jgi:hypothetical protein